MISSNLVGLKKITVLEAIQAAWLIIALSTSLLTISCTEKELDPADAKGAFSRAKEAYDDENYEIAIGNLGEFRARFPYSQYATESEILIANAQFNLARYPEAVVSYEQFVKLHPKHPQADFAMFRVGESYWKDAPEEVDREQEFTGRAITEWNKLIETRPDSPYSADAKKLIQQGRKRLADHAMFISGFYCKKKIYHSCAFRFMQVEEEFPEFPEIRKKALIAAADALNKLAQEKEKNPEMESNTLVKDRTAQQIREQARALKERADSVR